MVELRLERAQPLLQFGDDAAAVLPGTEVSSVQRTRGCEVRDQMAAAHREIADALRGRGPYRIANAGSIHRQ